MSTVGTALTTWEEFLQLRTDKTGFIMSFMMER